MRLKNVDPATLIGRTIIHRGKSWRFVEIGKYEFGEIRLVAWNGTKGLLSLRQLADCRLYPTMEEVEKQYPLLIEALRWSCILTQTEAVSCLHGYLTTGAFFMGGEAVCHIGGSLAAIRQALRCRAIPRRLKASARFEPRKSEPLLALAA